MVSKKLLAVICIVLILVVIPMQLIPPVTAVAKYEKFLGRGYNTTVIYSTHLGTHVIASGFGADISIMAPVEPGDSTFTKAVFAVELGENWTQLWMLPPFVFCYADCIPFADNMWVKVQGDSYFWPTPNQIVDNTGTGGECTLSWEDLLLKLLEVLAGLLFKLREAPPKAEWQNEAHWLKATVRQGGWWMYEPRLRTAGTNFYSYFDNEGYNMLTITAGADLKLMVAGKDSDGLYKTYIYDVTDYSIEFQVTFPVTNAPYTPSTPSGPTSGYVGTAYSYSTSTTDPNGDQLRYEFDWGDGSTTITPDWYASGATATASHSWSSPGTYNVKVRAQDSYYEWGDWSPYLTVNIVNRPPVKITIQAYPTTDSWTRSHGMSIDSPLPLEGDPNGPWWPPYNTGYEFLVTNKVFTYETVSSVSHYVDYAASGYVPNYAWHAKIYINDVLAAEGDVGRYTRLRAYIGTPVKITIQAYPTTDSWTRSHGMSIDSPLPLEGDPNGPWWPPYNTGYEFKVTSQAFTYDTTVYLSAGSHYVDYAASGYVPNYAWHAKIYINDVLKAEGDVGRYTRLRANFAL